MEAFQFSSFIIRIDKTSLSLSQDSKTLAASALVPPIHLHLVIVMRFMHNAEVELCLGRGFAGGVCTEISQVHMLV